MSAYKWNYENIKNFIESEEGKGCKLLTSKNEFEENCMNTYSKLEIQCGCNKEIFKTSFNKFKGRNKRQCDTCGREKAAKSKRKDGNEIYSIFISKNFTPLFKGEEYKNAFQKLPYLCNIHNDIGIQYISYSDILKGHGCKSCGKEKLVERFCTFEAKKKYYDLVIESGYIPMFNIEDYKGYDSPLPIICPNHVENGIIYASITNIKTRKACRLCGVEKISGKNNYNWNGGISRINSFLRNISIPWKKESLKFTNYKCILTGIKGSTLEIHHLVPFANIVEETFNICDLSIKSIVEEYNTDELKLLASNFKQINDSYGFGFVITKQLHNLFHSLYSNRNNTIFQLKEFIIRLRCGEFNNFLEENNLELNINYDVINSII